MAAKPSPRPVKPRPSVVVADTDTGASRRSAEHLLRLGATRADLRSIADHLHSGIPDPVALGRQQAVHMAEHVGTADTAPLGTIGAEHLADVAKPRRGQQGITQRVRGDVTIGMSGAAVSVSEQQTQQPARPSGLNWVYVGSEPDSGQSHCSSRKRSPASGWAPSLLGECPHIAGSNGLQEAAASASSRMVAAFSSSVFSASASSPTRI